MSISDHSLEFLQQQSLKYFKISIHFSSNSCFFFTIYQFFLCTCCVPCKVRTMVPIIYFSEIEQKRVIFRYEKFCLTVSTFWDTITFIVTVCALWSEILCSIIWDVEFRIFCKNMFYIFFVWNSLRLSTIVFVFLWVRYDKWSKVE